MLSAAMLLRYGIGEENAAKRIKVAVLDVLDRGFPMGDIYSFGIVSTIFFNVTFDYLSFLVSLKPNLTCFPLSFN